METAQRLYENRIKQLAEPLIEGEAMELVQVECLKMKSRWLVRIFIDKTGGVTLDDCAAISNQMGDLLSIHDIPPGPYTLEVSSPGLDRPLTRDKDFLKYRGHTIRVTVDPKLQGMRNFRGKLIDYLDEDSEKMLIIEMDGHTYRIRAADVKKARLEYDF